MLENSYKPGQVVCLFTPFTGNVLSIEDKEAQLQNGGHYGDLLSEEDRPDAEYLAIFDQLTDVLAQKLAAPIWRLVEHFNTSRPQDRPIVILSIARAGTPIGVVVSELLRHRFKREVFHYSVSVIHKHGVDAHAMEYLLKRHNASDMVFLDGWISQGRITKAVEESAPRWGVEPHLYCVSDPRGVQDFVATREDVLLPSAILNATVSGLLSRSVHNPDGLDFAQSYMHYSSVDRTQVFIDAMLNACFLNSPQEDFLEAASVVCHSSEQNPLARAQIESFCEKHGTTEERIKVGIGEVSRSVLRRTPVLVVIDPNATDEARHLVWLAKQRNIPLRVEHLNGPFRAFSILY